MLEAKAKDEGHRRKCSQKKKNLQTLFLGDLQTIFQAIYKILTIQKILLSSSRGQRNFQGLEPSRPRT